jgi:hypothetical protein
MEEKQCPFNRGSCFGDRCALFCTDLDGEQMCAFMNISDQMYSIAENLYSVLHDDKK